MRTLVIPVAALVAAALLPASGRAADEVVGVLSPAGRPVGLAIRDNGTLLCLTAVVDRETPKRTAPCRARPRTARDDVAGLRVSYRATPEKLTVIYGVLSPATAELRVTLGDGRALRLRPPAGPYNLSRGYLLAIAGRPPMATVRAVDAEGVIRAASDFDARAVKASRGPVRLAATRDELGRRAELTAFTADLYPPRSRRRAAATCVAVSALGGTPVTRREPGYTGGSACAFNPHRIVIKYASGCAARRLLLFGFAPVGVARFELVTASGARLTAETQRLHDLGRTGNAFVISRRDPGRLRRLQAYTRSGRLVATVPLSDVGASCGASSRS